MAEPSSSGPPSNLPAVALTETAIRERFAPSDVRKKQIQALAAQIGRSNRPPIWAALMTCDERRLEILRAKCDCDPMFRTIFGAFSSSIAEAVMACKFTYSRLLTSVILIALDLDDPKS